MKKGWGLGEKHREDPIGSDAPRGKDCSQRKSAKDGPSWTPSEARLKGQLMRQFMRNPEGGGGVSDAFRDGYDAIDWTK